MSTTLNCILWQFYFRCYSIFIPLIKGNNSFYSRQLSICREGSKPRCRRKRGTIGDKKRVFVTFSIWDSICDKTSVTLLKHLLSVGGNTADRTLLGTCNDCDNSSCFLCFNFWSDPVSKGRRALQRLSRSISVRLWIVLCECCTILSVV